MSGHLDADRDCYARALSLTRHRKSREAVQRVAQREYRAARPSRLGIVVAKGPGN